MHYRNFNLNIFLTPVKKPVGAWRRILLSGIEGSTDKYLCNDFQRSDACLIDTHRSSLEEVKYYQNLCLKSKVPLIGVDYSDETRLKNYVDGFFRINTKFFNHEIKSFCFRLWNVSCIFYIKYFISSK